MCTNQYQIQNYILNDAVYSSINRALSVYKTLDYQVELILFDINWCGIVSAYVCCVPRKYSMFICHKQYKLKLKCSTLSII